MNNVNEFDVIVVGGGQGGGLPAATYLQKAGARVALIDARHELGAMNVTHEYIPGCFNTFCTGVMLNGIAPMWEDLNLEDYGAKLLLSPMHVGSLFPDGTCLFHYYDMQANYDGIARFSKKDAERAKRIYEGIARNTFEFNKLAWFALPTPEHLEHLWDLAADMWGIPTDDFKDMNAFELLESTFESEHVRQHFLCAAGPNVGGDIGEKGHGTFTIPFNMSVFPGQLLGGNHKLVHVMTRIFLDHGGTILRNCPVEKVMVENGVATGVKLLEAAPYSEKEIRARHAVISGVSVPLLLDMVGEDVLKEADATLTYKIKNWDMAARGTVVITYILKGFPKWRAIEFDPAVTKAHFYFKMPGSWDNLQKWYLALKSNDLWSAFGHYHEIAIPGTLDTSQVSPEGYVAVRTEDAVPFFAFRRQDGTPEMWDDEEVRKTLLQKRTDAFEELAPGFKEQIMYSYVVTPLDLWRYNPSLIHGCASSGSYVPTQWYLDRMPYRMPIKGLYMASSVWPPQFSVGAGGYNAACVVAEDMGIREQPWWTHSHTEWFFKNLERNMVIL